VNSCPGGATPIYGFAVYQALKRELRSENDQASTRVRMVEVNVWRYDADKPGKYK
jgi:hypothetical protein